MEALLSPTSALFRRLDHSSQCASQSRLLTSTERLQWTGKRPPCTSKVRRRTVSVTNASSFDGRAEEMPGTPAVFPRINVRDPYKRLGISREASEEEIREAHSYLINEYGGHDKSKASIEKAYDEILMQSLRVRRKSRDNLKGNLKKKIAESPPWVRKLLNRFEVPSTRVIIVRAVFFALLGLWSVLNSGEGGPAFQVAVSVAGCIYLLNDRLKVVWKSLIIGFCGLVVGWVLGSCIVPFLPPSLYPRTWSLELMTALISYIFLWFSCTFLK